MKGYCEDVEIIYFNFILNSNLHFKMIQIESFQQKLMKGQSQIYLAPKFYLFYNFDFGGKTKKNDR